MHTIILKILSLVTDPDLRMPPPESGKTLSPAEIARVKAWIDGGAEWTGHWAFETPQQPAIPDKVDEWYSENPIDLFIQARLRSAKLQPESQFSGCRHAQRSDKRG